MFTSHPLQKYIDGSTVLNTKNLAFFRLVDPDVLQSIQLYREWKVQMKVLPISMYAVDKRPEFNALGQYKDVPFRALLD
jgi:hypothetical protein